MVPNEIRVGVTGDEPTELRCPRHRIRLMLKVARPRVVDGANLIEVACRDCRKELRAQGQQVTDVIHVFNVIGEHISTRVVRA